MFQYMSIKKIFLVRTSQEDMFMKPPNNAKTLKGKDEHMKNLDTPTA